MLKGSGPAGLGNARDVWMPELSSKPPTSSDIFVIFGEVCCHPQESGLKTYK